jgi:hypothetical protein
MRLALLMIAAATAVTSASASTPVAASAEPKTEVPVSRHASIAAFLTSGSYRQFQGDATLAPLTQPGTPDSMATGAAPHAIPTPPAPPAPHAAALQTVALEPATEQASQTDQHDSGWEAFAPVAVTLTLIGAIALRRHKAEGS